MEQLTSIMPTRESRFDPLEKLLTGSNKAHGPSAAMEKRGRLKFRLLNSLVVALPAVRNEQIVSFNSSMCPLLCMESG